MLGLGHEIGGQESRVGRPVGHDEDFTGPGHHVDIHLAVDQPLGRCHEYVAGTDDLVHLRHRLGAVGQGRHGLGAAHQKDTVYTGDVGGGQNVGIGAAVL